MKFVIVLIVSLLSSIAFAQDLVGNAVNASGTLVDQRGYKIRYSAPYMENVFKTGLVYVKNPQMTIYLPDGSSFAIQADTVTMDTSTKELLFKNIVKIKTKNGELQTNFMKLALRQLHLTSSSPFTFHGKTKKLPKKFQGQAFYASTTDYKLHLFNLKGGKSKSLDF
ncbi:MAG: hypothetical protein A2Z91_06485 [Deltaproteobacteria bacterium GWA2_38_16]|nr:MAG: hypothetical protein A2Z91_06485 [Deltaproteobacteria bacterium GWA2_38_16]OGQ03435.1 MAG: hypothetical protein A3D19_04925 [Deltaproteobacteria bacterium RIFCSPHIGHO2_02_FULL_38_15]OGQ30106.1 MAG: hypothetical protein A3A72_06995 [Deltaproteobacteria bacterium RIFCSPLOWO2_01_FULL_38_9]OGQ59276.1 MAG: hypothetical protein A3G92_01510 [Deltaproteobacteria bacterium RIFCSPLOWO2_12_FULL_38_8]HBQ21353.1 hypothetical protein [Deltaproteobacteria bacterium]